MSEELMQIIVATIPFVVGLGFPLLLAIPYKISAARKMLREVKNEVHH